MELSPAASKGLLTLAGVGAAGSGLAGGAYLLKKTDTIQDHIKSLNLELISSLETSKVSAQWEAEFNLGKESIKASISSIDSWEKLKNWCSESLKAKSEGNGDLISKVRKWCVLGTIEEKLARKKGIEFISDTDSEGWEKIYTDNSVSTDREAIGLAGTKNDSQNKDSDKQKIKDFCNTKKTEKFLAETKTTSADRVEKWCTKTSNQAR
ncbi:hypothetical protein MHF_1389 [Mycoplasma haemofelis Ohio2]|uniref:Uncharacterized protein n=1 Tax=Mycoplasma haemofelis (strain Ohio2) TaxID=859194 RepID=F6FGI7_MYCHI|nr:hypothetical protein MHF_1389 [Mycoplasma haemofelis Ohio2]